MYLDEFTTCIHMPSIEFITLNTVSIITSHCDWELLERNFNQQTFLVL